MATTLGKPMMLSWRQIRLTGLTIVALAILVFGWWTSFGFLKVAALSTVASLLLVDVLDRKSRGWAPQLLLMISATYVALLLLEVGLWLISPGINPSISIRGMYTADEELGYRLTPGWEGQFDDGVASAYYAINSLGNRNREPGEGAAGRVLLLGDSFTFGDLLENEQTIGRQLEEVSTCNTRAYNLGVSGYGTNASLRTFERSPVDGEWVVYLFYENDLRTDNLQTSRNTVWRGFLVPRLDDTGQPLTPERLDAGIDTALSPPVLSNLLRLRHLFGAVQSLLKSAQSAKFRELEDGGGESGHAGGEGPLGYRGENVAPVVESSIAMRDAALRRGMNFAVMIVPSLTETRAQQHYGLVERYLRELKVRGITVLDPLKDFSVEDYFLHDGHFNPSGARKAAKSLADLVCENVR